MTPVFLVLITSIFGALALFYRHRAQCMQQELGAALYGKEEPKALSHGEALQAVVLLKRRMRSYEYANQQGRVPLPRIPDETILGIHNEDSSWISDYLASLAPLCKKLFNKGNCAFLFEYKEKVHAVMIGNHEPLLEVVLRSFVDIRTQQYTPVTLGFERFGLEESTASFFESHFGIKGALWIGFEKGYEPLTAEISESNSIAREIGEVLTQASEKLRFGNGQERRERFTAQNDFLAQISHDIRSPLNNIRSILHLFRLEGITNDGSDLISVGLKNCEVMNEIVETILDYSAQQNGKIQIRREEMSLSEIVQEVIDTYNLPANLKKLKLTYQHESEIIMNGDRRHLRRILSNLVSNAIKYTSSGHVIVRCLEHGMSGVQIAVEDTGVGLTPEQLKRLFEPFSRFQPGLAEGAGLGLVVTKSLVEAGEGILSVHSEYGRGTTFTVTFPLALSAPHRTEQSLPSPLISIDKKHNILVIDDDCDWAHSLSRSLERKGYSISIARTAPEAIGMLQVAEFDAVITDRQMPGGGGVRVIQYLQDQQSTIPALLISGIELSDLYPLPEWVSTGLKPIDSEKIIVWLKAMLDPELAAVA